LVFIDFRHHYGQAMILVAAHLLSCLMTGREEKKFGLNRCLVSAFLFHDLF